MRYYKKIGPDRYDRFDEINKQTLTQSTQVHRYIEINRITADISNNIPKTTFCKYMFIKYYFEETNPVQNNKTSFWMHSNTKL